MIYQITAVLAVHGEIMAELVDIHGNPLRQSILREPQTAKLSALYKEYANHPVKGLTPAKMARILLDAEKGNLQAQSELFQDMEERDAHLFAEMNKRNRAPLTLNRAIEPPANATPAEKADTDYLKEVLEDQNGIPNLILGLQKGIGHGFAAIEIEWELVGKNWLPKEFHERPQSWFQLNPNNQNELRIRKEGVPEGLPLAPFGWIIHRPQAVSGYYLARSGLYRVLAWPFLFKNYAITDLAEMLEIYGLPLRIGKYPPGTTDAEKATLLRAVTGLGHSAAGIIPQSMIIEFEQAAQGTSDPFLAMQKWADASISKAILGGTLTSQTDGGSGAYALGKVHGDMLHDLLESDASQLGDTFTNQLLWYVLALNRPGQNNIRRLPKYVFDTKLTEDIEKLAKSVPVLVDYGLKISTNWLYEKTGIPEPTEGEEILKKSVDAQPSGMFSAQQPKNTAALTIISPVAQGQQPLDKANDSLDPDLINAEMVKLLQPVFDAFNELGDKATADDFYDILADTYPNMDASELRELIARAIFASKVWGRLNG